MEPTAKDTMLSVVKAWIKNDAEIRVLQKEQQARKVVNKQLSEQLMQIMKHHGIDCLDIKDGKIVYKKKTIRKAISKKMLYEVLNTYFQGNTEQTEHLNAYILNHREHVVKESVEFQPLNH